MADQDIPQAQGGGFWGGLFGVLGPKFARNAQDLKSRKDLEAKTYMEAIQSGRLSPEQIDYSLAQVKKIYGDKESKAILDRISQGVGQHIQAQSQAPQGQPAPSGPPSGPGGASPGGTMMAQAALPPPVPLQQPPGGGGQAPPSQVTGGALPPPAMPAPSPAQVLPPPGGMTPGSVLGRAFPNPEARADYVDVREHQHELESSALKLHQAAEIAREEGTQDYEIWLKRGQEVLGPKASARDLAEYAGSHGTKLPTQSGANQVKVWIKRPGSDDPEPAFVDRIAKSGYVDINGEPLPDGTKAVGSPREEQIRAAVQGYYMYWKGKGLSDEQAKAKAGEDYRENAEKRLGRVEQIGSIDQIISGGIGLGPGFTAPTAHTTPIPTRKPAPTGTLGGTTPPGTPRANRMLSAPTPDNPMGLSSRDMDAANFAVGVLTGLQKGTGKAAAQTIQGQKVLARVGVTPEEITSRKEQRDAAKRTIDRLTPVTEVIDALDSALARHGTILNNARAALPSSDIIKLNDMMLKGIREFNLGGLSNAGVQYGLALQAVRNEYARIIEGSGASISATSDSAMKQAGEKMASGFSKGNIGAMVSMIQTETKNKYGGYTDKLRQLQARMSQPLVPELHGGKYVSPIPVIPPPTDTTGAKPTTAEEYLKSLGR